MAATRSAFLDAHGRFAKQASDIVEIRLFDDECNVVGTMTYEAYRKLPTAEQRALQQLGSAAGCVETAGKSNA